jgi:hypothetical protein
MAGSAQGIIDLLTSVDLSPGDSWQTMQMSRKGGNLGLGVEKRRTVEGDRKPFSVQNPRD